MFKSKEIRWFNQERSKTISRWFANQGLNFNTTKTRTDYYLVAYNNDNITSKLREGNIEIKYRISVPRKHQLLPNVEGYFEDWVKWSFKLDAKDTLSTKIINGNKYISEWVKVDKKRMGVKLAKGKDGTLMIQDIKDLIDNGCQVEYTDIKLKGQVWYSFNLEWFGDDFLNLNSSFYSEIFGDSILRLEDSMGFGSFLAMRESEH